MKTWALSTVIILVIASALYSLVYFWAIPMSARMSIPLKWREIPLNQKRTIVRGYFGRPVLTDTTGVIKDVWESRRDNLNLVLEVRYNRDTIARSYSISYSFENFLFRESGIITDGH